MNVSKNRLQIAKKLFENKQFAECKNVLLEIIANIEGNVNHTLLERIGTVCIELGAFDEAKKYFQLSINENPTNPSIYISFGSLLSDHLNDYSFAQQMFDNATKIVSSTRTNSQSDRLWFNYGKLMYKTRNVKRAIECYSKCIKERACVHYHFAKALLAIGTAENTRKAKHKLQRATALKPNIAMYHHTLALTYIKTKEYDLAHSSFTNCLQRTQHKDAAMLNDYADFIQNICEDSFKAMEYRQIAYDLDHQHTPNSANHTIQLMIYDFDECIAYWNLSQLTLESLQNMKRMDIVHTIFGGMDRIRRLQTHFERILSLENHIQLVVVSPYDCDIVIEAIQRASLYQYLSNAKFITSRDILINVTQNKQQTLFIHSKEVDSASAYCRTYHVSCQHLLNGLSIQSMLEIEQMLEIVQPIDELCIDTRDINAIVPQMEATGMSLSQMDETVYKAIKDEVCGMSDGDSIQSLPVIQWIEEHWESGWKKDAFICFARQYKTIRSAKRQQDSFWLLLNVVPWLLKLSPTDAEFTSRYAQALSYFLHHEEAEEYFKRTMKYGGDSGFHCHLYAYWLYEMKRYKEAEIYFVKAISYPHTVQLYYYQSCLGYARTLEHLKNYQQADYYYRKAIECKQRKGKMQYFYGIFLFNHHRYCEARDQFEVAVRHYPHRASNHFWLSQTLLKLKNFEASDYHSKQAFTLDPHLNDTSADWTRYHYDVFQGGPVISNSTNLPTTNYHTNQTFQYKGKRPLFSPRKMHFINSSLNPLKKREGVLSAAEMEPRRAEMQFIAQNELEIPLDKLPNVYAHYFHGLNIKSVYHGKLKKLAMYYDDLFEIKWTKHNNKVYLISKIYALPTQQTHHRTKQVIITTPDKTNAHIPLERYRKEMEIIGQREHSFYLSLLPDLYRRYFNGEINPTRAAGKCKNIALYFNDIFQFQRCRIKNNAAILVSKIYKHPTKLDSNAIIGSVNQSSKQSENPMEETCKTTATDMSNNAIAFERFWFMDVNVFSKSFSRYYSQFIKHKMNDIACLLDDEIETKLQTLIGVNAPDDLKVIMKHIRKLKLDNQSFMKILKDQKFMHIYPMFTDGAIYTVKALKHNIKSKEAIQSMVECYIPGSNDDALVSSIWDIKQKDDVTLEKSTYTYKDIKGKYTQMNTPTQFI